MTLYALDHVTKVFGNKTVLDISDLSIAKGHIYGLLGPNGAGKTTLLKILGLLDAPTTGTVIYKSHPIIFSEKYLLPLRKHIVMIDQHPILFTTTVCKNLEFGLKIRNIAHASQQKIITESLELLGIRHLTHAPAHKLSGGETQRVAIARALALQPDVILCDEPVSSVDIENQIVIVDLLRQINQEKGVTLVFTSHDRLHAASLAQQTFFLDHGKLAPMSYENLFAAKFDPDGHAGSCAVIQNTLVMQLDVKKKGKARIIIDPEKIRIPANASGKNIFSGSIRQISAEKNRIRLVIDSGVTLSAVLSHESYRSQGLMIGDNVTFEIPPGAVHFL